jgi:hypothetical protein
MRYFNNIGIPKNVSSGLLNFIKGDILPYFGLIDRQLCNRNRIASIEKRYFVVNE